MKITGKLALAGLMFASSAMVALAVPAKPGIMLMHQADGSTVEVRLMGDERHHQYFTADGYLLALDGGNYCYASVNDEGRVVSSGMVARASGNRSAADRAFLATIDQDETLARLNRAAAERDASGVLQNLGGVALRPADAQAAGPERGYGLFPESRFPGMGKQKAIVILVEYTDVKFQTSYDPHDYFTRMLNEQGFSSYGGTGSAHDFFLECSMGQFDCDFDLYGPITLSQNQAYYGGNDWYGNDKNPEKMVTEACAQLDDIVDFSEYDRDHDGYVDNVFVFYAGRGEASGGAANTVWPHSWTVSSAGSGTPVHDGVRIDRYACSNEWESGRPDGVGTFVHEFSHVMGLPDLYATSYTGAFTPGAWSAMDYGPYNNNGCTPPLYSAFERNALDWMQPAVIDGAMNATLPPISQNVAGIIHTAKDTEFFLVENRQQTGWDAYIPGHGMIVWHVDYNTSVWNSNKVNNTPSHQYVDMEEADGTQSEGSRAGDAFPGTSHVTSFTSSTNPAMKTWSGTAINYPITDIAETNGIITFKVLGGAAPLANPDVEISESTPETLTLTWTPSEADLVVSVYSLPASEGSMAQAPAQAVYFEGYTNRNLGRSGSHTIEGLQPMTTYYVEAYHQKGLQASASTDPIEGYTGRPTLDRMQMVALDATDEHESGFTANWTPIEEANDYLLSVNKVVFGFPFEDGCNFDGGVTNLPNGWTSNSTASYANTAYSGAAIPALRLGKGGAYIQSPEYDDNVSKVTFWMRGNKAGETDVIVVMARVNGTWTKAGEVAIENAAGGQNVEFTDFPEDTRAVRLDFVRNGVSGSVAIDDIVVYHGATYGEEPVAEWQQVHTGDTDHYQVYGLEPDNQYTYRLAATDGELVSKTSNSVTVVTKPSTSIAAPVAGTLTVTAVAHDINVVGATPGLRVAVTDIAGRLVYAGTTDSNGNFAASLPAAGVYFVQAGSEVAKVLVR